MTEPVNTNPTARRMKRTARAFSLLEITLVLVIIGLLAAVAAVNVVGGAERARVRTTRASMTTIEQALKNYQLDNAAYPENLSVLITAKYLDDKALNDAWGSAFVYRTPGRANNPYEIISMGKDKQVGTEDDLSIWDDEKPTP
ncbi:MAG: type II secretion system protein GspG [Phycisphaerales bacterium]|jgi:general secretion pathway protein G|nr:type II secretion system protein GspG [Phycisphaerales bacterium]